MALPPGCAWTPAKGSEVKKILPEVKNKNPALVFIRVYQFVVIREIIVLQSVWYFLNGPGCLNIAFFIC